jgi:hypothetical protein
MKTLKLIINLICKNVNGIDTKEKSLFRIT